MSGLSQEKVTELLAAAVAAVDGSGADAGLREPAFKAAIRLLVDGTLSPLLDLLP